MLQVFIFRDGRFWGTECFSQGKVVMGRSPDVDLELDDDLCSRNHASITQTPEGLILEDLGSSNGTFVNGEPVARCYVTSKDEVTVGHFQLKFKLLAKRKAQPRFQGSTRMVAREDVGAPPLADEPVSDITARQSVPSFEEGEPEELETQVTAQALRPEEPAPEEDWGRVPETQRVAGLPSREALDPGRAEAGDRVATQISPELQPQPPAEPAPGEGRWVEPPAEAPEEPALELAREPEPARARPRTQAPVKQAVAEPAPARPEPAPRFEPAAPPPAEAFGGAFAAAPAAASAAPLVASDDLDEDEEEELEVQNYVEPFSLLHNLVSENFAQSRVATEPRLTLEIIGYNQDKKVQEYAELGVGATYRTGGEKLGLVRCTGEGSCRIRITPDMTGGVIVDGRTVSIEQYRTPENLDPKATGASVYNCTLRKGDYANLMTPSGCWFMRFVFPPRLPPVPKLRPDPSFLRSLGSSAGLHIVGMIVLGIVAALNAQATTEEPTDRFAQIDLKDLEIEKPEEEPEVPLDELPPPEEKPEEVKPEKKPEEAPKPVKTEKPRPTKKSSGKPAPAQDPGGGAGIMAALGNLSQKKPTTNIVAAVTNLDAVRVPGGNARYKVSGLVTKLPTSNVVFSNGQGVGVKAGIELLRGGKGNGAAGIGPGALSGGVTGKRKVGGVVFKAPTRSMKVRGSLSKEAIAAVVKKHLAEIQYCYEKNLLLNPNLSGKVIMEWTIALNGSVSLVKTGQNTMNTPAVAMCISAKIKSWKFPEPKGGTVEVTYPFMFNTVGF
ncbi:MAG TPA: AgmX/PglI C-terminal domain-containing protein [Myxococcota bacterium]|nr:AgmX/PglI C-terminal domain-containing protein [Myxococcota bacterium]HRY95178.1 AgmX/PglI C-terminal domain-containing protein [Myxococcota bacterium]